MRALTCVLVCVLASDVGASARASNGEVPARPAAPDRPLHAPSADASGVQRAIERARGELARLRHDEPPSTEELVQKLAAIGLDALPALLEPWSHSAAATHERAITLAALREWPTNQVDARLRHACASPSALATRHAGVLVMAELGLDTTLAAWSRLALEEQRAARMGPEGEAPLVAALATLFERAPLAQARLAHALHELEPSLRVLVARASARAARAEGIDLLERLLALDPAAAPTLVPELARLCRLHPNDDARHALERLRARLEERDDGAREIAARALGEAVDPSAAPLLADLLVDEDGLVRRAALGALRALSGHAWGPDRARWRAWCDTEATWRARSFERACARLTSPQPTTALRALEELERHPLYAHDIATHLATLVEGARPAFARALVGVIDGLRSGAASQALRAAAEHDDRAVREAARAALARQAATRLDGNER